MCGIVGILLGSAARAVDGRLLARMNDSQSHRGPDDAGLYVGAGVGLGHRRLSIIDLAGGHQPLFNEDDSIAVVYNGEIYNFVELMEELVARGHRFRTRCDTEVIVHAWEEWGEACVERFRGMFAFAIWDENEQTLFVARDRLGIKPFYYAWLADGTFLFASEMKALLVHPELVRTIDPHAVEDYFAYGYVPDPKTIYGAIAKLPPAHRMSVRRDGRAPQPAAYWDVCFRDKWRLDAGRLEEELLERLREAVRMRLIAEVPLGAFLSGGVDSSAVVAMMAGLMDQPVQTCSIAFADPAFDESRFAAQVAERYRTRHHVHTVDAGAIDLVDRLIDLYDEPFADSSAMPTLRVCSLAREQVTVALSGDGGDEMFAGYRRYRWHGYEERMRRRLPLGLRRALFGALGSAYPKLDWAPRPLRAKSTFQALARDTVGGYFHGVSILPDGLRQRLYSADLRARLAGYDAKDVIRRWIERAPTDDPVERVQYADMKTYLPGDILTKVDRASMAVALEVRVPILDHVFVEWAARLPAGLKLSGGEGKSVFKKALQPLLPHEVLYRNKMGFSVPLAAWFRGPLRERLREAIASARMRDSGLFDMASVGRLADQHAAGVSDHSAALWAIFMFAEFLGKVHARQPAPAALRVPASVGE